MEHEHGPDHHAEWVNDVWEKGNKDVAALLEHGADSFLRDRGSLEEAFHEGDVKCACIDERVGDEKFGLPGSGILLGKEKAAKIIRAKNITRISSHEHCGAAALAFKELSPEEQEKYGDADGYAEAWTQELADELGITYMCHEPVEGGDQHIARAVYYDGTGRFDLSRAKLPAGFLVSRYGEAPTFTASGVPLAVSIAMGEHGFGERFTPEMPLVVVPVANSSRELGTLVDEINRALEKSEHLDRVRIDAGIVAPARKQEAA